MNSIVNAKTCSANQVIPVRKLDFSFKDTPKYWLGQNPHATLFLTALSGVFPEGERGFIRSVRNYQAKITDAHLLTQIKGFIGQEAHHGRVHEEFNEFMQGFGLPMNDINRQTKRNVEFMDTHFSDARRLANTCALEHFTAIFAETLMASPALLAKFSPEVRALFLWHAIEESEHKSLAYDVYQQQVGDYAIRARVMIVTSIIFSVMSVKHAIFLLRKDKQLFNLKSAIGFIPYLVGKNGLFHGMLPKYLAYYRRDFHPSQFDSSHLQANAKLMLEELLGYALD